MQTYDVQDEMQGTYSLFRPSTPFLGVHHAAFRYPTRRGIDDVRSVARYHTREKGWPGIGYHIALAEETEGGPIARYNLSDLELQRAHIAYQNHQAIGVACLTNFTGIPEQKWIDALALVIRDLLTRYPNAQIVGHREIAVEGWETTCPGPRWFEWKPRLLELVRSGEAALPVALPLRAPHWYRVPAGRVAVLRYQPASAGNRNIGAYLHPGTRLHVAEWADGWARLSAGGYVHQSGIESEE
jgi:hypothetical protein